MAGWGGFTDEEVRRLKKETLDKNAEFEQNNARSKHQAQRQARLQSIKSQKPKVKVPSKDGNVDIPPEQRLSAPKVKPQTNKTRSKNDGDNLHPLPNTAKVVEEVENKDSHTPGETGDHLKDTKDQPEESVIPEELDEKEIFMRNVTTMENFQKQQKQMEELNKQKRAILATAIQQRQKMAFAEANKLKKLHKELDHLDELLTEDVSKIRDRIEGVSRDYLEAQKRYEKAEREFIAAKIDLHEKEELKQSLTEHLYTVIHHNEVRKSKKLAELMEQLEMEEAAELTNLPVMLPELPVFNTSVVIGPKSPTSPNTASRTNVPASTCPTTSQPATCPVTSQPSTPTATNDTKDKNTLPVENNVDTSSSTLGNEVNQTVKDQPQNNFSVVHVDNNSDKSVSPNSTVHLKDESGEKEVVPNSESSEEVPK